MADGPGIPPEVTPLTPPTTEAMGGVVPFSTAPQGKTNPIRSVFSTARGLFGSPNEPTPGIQPLGTPVSDRPLDIDPAAPAPEPTAAGFSPQPAEQPASVAAPEAAVPPAPDLTPQSSLPEDPFAPKITTEPPASSTDQPTPEAPTISDAEPLSASEPTAQPEKKTGPLSPEELEQYRELNERLLDQLASDGGIADANKGNPPALL